MPDFEDIPKTQDTFWKDTTLENLIDGSDGGTKVKVYKQPGSSFILCQTDDNTYEYIQSGLEDGKFANGVYRERFANGDTEIGSRYFLRSGRKVDRVYRLLRYNYDGEIRYTDKVMDNTKGGWKWLEEYIFNPETLEWSRQCW